MEQLPLCRRKLQFLNWRFGPAAVARDEQLQCSRNLTLTVPSEATTKTVSLAYGGGAQVCLGAPFALFVRMGRK
jgi:hypothetical protein